MNAKLLDDLLPLALGGFDEEEVADALDELSADSDTSSSPDTEAHSDGDADARDTGALATGLYADAMREISLLSREEETALGRTIRDSRLQTTQALSHMPCAVRHFLAVLEQVKRGERPATDALFAPFGVAVESEGGDDAQKGRSRVGWVHAAQRLESSYRAWTERPERPRYERVRHEFVQMEPAVVVLGEALDVCRELDCRVRMTERATGTFHADILCQSEHDFLDAEMSAARDELEILATEAGTDLTTLRESCETAAGAHKRYRHAQRRMVEANIRLAHFMAHKLKGHGVDFEDLVQDAMLGLMRAADKFDYRLGYKFSTYACQWIWQSITRSLADGSRTIRVAAHMHDTVIALRKVSRELEQRLGRDPSAAELAAASGVEEDKIRRALHAARQPLSLDAPLAELDDATLHACIPDSVSEAATGSVHDAHLAARIDAVLGELPPREAFIVRLRHGIGGTESHTLEEIGKLLGITRERTRQIETRAMTRLRDSLDPALMEGLGE